MGANKMSQRSYLISGAGSGIGAAIAKEIAEKDSQSRLYLLGRNAAKLEKVLKELPRAREHQLVIADLQNKAQLGKALREALAGESNLVGVIANAGVGGANQYGDSDRWHEVIATNLTGTYYMVEEALPYLRKAKTPYRNVVITASILARLGVPGYTAYCASKAGLLGLMRSWAVSLASEKILVNAICPGWVDTAMSDEGMEGIAKALGMSVEAAHKMEMGRVPLGKMSQPAEVASLVNYLVSGVQTSITGQTLDINGGALMP